jgi:hypothetical protein
LSAAFPTQFSKDANGASGPAQSGQTMTRRKGEITRSDLKRKWRHHVVLPAEKVRGLANSELVYTLRRPYQRRR